MCSLMCPRASLPTFTCSRFLAVGLEVSLLDFKELLMTCGQIQRQLRLMELLGDCSVCQKPGRVSKPSNNLKLREEVMDFMLAGAGKVFRRPI